MEEAIGGVAGGGNVVGEINVEGVEGEEKEEVRSWDEAWRGGKGVAGPRPGVGGPEEDTGEDGCTIHILEFISFSRRVARCRFDVPM